MRLTRRLALALPLIGCRKHAASDAKWRWAFNGRSWQLTRTTDAGAMLYAVVEPSRQHPGMWSAYEWDERTLGPGRTIVLTVPLALAKERTERHFAGWRKAP